MSLRGPPEVFAREVRPRLLAAPAELILDALPPLQPQMRFLEVGAGGAVVARPLLERIAGLGRLVAIDDDVDLACALPNAPKRAARAVAGFPQLPFAADVFDVAIANLVLGEVSKDGPRLAELRRVLRTRGVLVATVALRGSFDHLFEILAEACVAASLLQLHATTLQAKAALPDEDALAQRLTSAGYVVSQLGVEERLLCLLDGKGLLNDPLVTEILLPSLLGVPLPDSAQGALARALDSRFPAGMPLIVRTGIVSARVEKNR